ncbi:MAG: acyl-CoA dehydrogenase family protein [Acidimicrobiales bacterium]
MYLEETAEQQAFRKEVRAYFGDLMTDSLWESLRGAHETSEIRRQLFRRLGDDAMMGVGWPTEYGGQGRPPTDQFIFFDEAQRANFPMPFVTLNTVGPTLMEFGNDAQKAFYLPKILAGEITFAIGYSEAGAGTDLASLTTKAVRDGDEWIISGQKMWTSGANEADYIWLACRTDPEVKKHKGISLIIVPTDSPGFSWTPIVTVGGGTTTATYYDDVRVPYENLVGDENGGWRMITTQLNHERVGLAAVGAKAFRLYDDVVRWAAVTPSGEGGVVIDLPWVQMDLARCHAKLEALNLFNWRMTVDVENGELTPDRASSAKVYGTEALNDVYHALLNVLGAEAHLRDGSPGALLRGEVESAGRAAQINTFGGGVNEIQREIVAWLGLGMARASR